MDGVATALITNSSAQKLHLRNPIPSLPLNSLCWSIESRAISPTCRNPPVAQSDHAVLDIVVDHEKLAFYETLWKSDVLDELSQRNLARQFSKDMPVEDSTTYKLHTLTHHFE